eukprot:m.129844 g.129844  ORF g.129844 m.129844 type:complete len:760 (+) comp15859_c0_seq2:37-2316(+)
MRLVGTTGVHEAQGNGPTFIVEVVKATGLLKKSFVLSDPYVVGSLLTSPPHTAAEMRDIQGIGGSIKTSVVPKNLNPEWNESLAFRWSQSSLGTGSSNGPNVVVMLQIFDQKPLLRDSFLGQVMWDLSMLPPQHNSIHTASYVSFPLRKRTTKSRVTGILTVRMGYDVDPNPSSVPEVSATTARLLRASLTDDVDDQAELPANVQRTVDRNGREQYTNIETRQVFGSLEQALTASVTRTREQAAQLSNVLAREAQDDEPDSPSESAEAEADTTASARVTTILGSGPLPPGWIMQRTKNGRPFFIDHNTQKTTWEDPRLTMQADSEANDAEGLGPLPLYWEERFTQAGRKFFVNHRERKTQWEDPRTGKPAKMEDLEVVPGFSRDFARKKAQFRSKLLSNQPSGHHDIPVRRDHIMEDSFQCITKAKPRQLMQRMNVSFQGERGLDYGGPAREWFLLLSQEMFNPYYGLFEYSALDNYTLQINANSNVNPEHLAYFEFIGRVVGMALYHGKLIDAYFIQPFYKMLLNLKIVLADLEAVDAEFFNSLQYILANDPADVGLTFVVSHEEYGEVKEVPLKPNGADIDVTISNRAEYVDLVLQNRFVDRVSSQVASFRKGLTALVPEAALAVFDPSELELLIGGISVIDVNDWRVNTDYREYSAQSSAVKWFWEAVHSLSKEQKARLLQFVTGTSRVPIGGFAQLYGSNGAQKFCIARRGNSNSLPRAHTCFNRLDLPEYDTYQQLRKKLILAIDNTTGYDGVD